MNLTARVAAAIVALVAMTSLLSWILANRLVFRPLIDEVLDAWIAEVAFVGERLDRGTDAKHLARALELEIQPHQGPIPAFWRFEERNGRKVWIPPGPRNLIVVDTQRGPMAVRRELDLQRPGQRLPLVLLTVAIGVVLLSVAIARRGVRPLATATHAMTRMASGDLDHRLDASGPAELRSAAAAFNAMADRISGLLRAEKQLLAGISHELRTPLTRLTLEIELLRDAGVEGKRLDRMSGDLLQLDALVGEALELSRLQLGQRPLERTPIELTALATRALEAVDVGDRPVRIEGSGPPIELDVRLVTRALTNLLQNAVKYTPTGTPLGLTVHGAAIEVWDAGPGVPAEELHRVFEPFYRTASGSRRAEGLGLGLMIVREVVELHGGVVSARDHAPGLCVRLDFAPR